jgi:Protein kinase domain
LDDRVRRAEFARQLYNLLHLEVEEDEDRDTIIKTNQLEQKIRSERLDALFTRDGTQGTKQKRRRTDVGAGESRGSGGKGTAHCAELRAHGYEVQSQVIVDANGGTWEPLFEVWRPLSAYYTQHALTLRPQMPSHIHIVYRPRPEEELVAKKVRMDSNELAILKHLNTIQPRSEHVISLLDSFHAQSGPWVILPRMDSISDYIANARQKLESKATQVCWGLIKGLAYLHELCIAHRDIKPDNLVVDQDFCLKIIDFDIALQLKNEDEEVDDECGTTHWMAPEVKTSTTYSPIRADRWSCGRVLLYLFDELETDDERLRAIGRKLEAHNPNQRPSLLKWHSWLPVPLLNMGERKASQPQQDSMVVNGGDTTVPNAKKQRLAALVENDTVGQFPVLDEPQASESSPGPVVRVH